MILLSILLSLIPSERCFSEEGVMTIVENIVIKESLEAEVEVLNEAIEELMEINEKQAELISIMSKQNEHLTEYLSNVPRIAPRPLKDSRCGKGCKASLVVVGAVGGGVLTYLITK